MYGLITVKDYFSFAPEEKYIAEAKLFEDTGAKVVYLNQESLDMGNVKLSPVEAGITYIYRGWMLTDSQYKQLENKVAEAGAQLLVTSEAYNRSHHFEGWYDQFKKLTPASWVIPANAPDFTAVPDGKYFVKDSVKSVLEEGTSFTNRNDLESTVDAYIDARGDYLQGNIIVRDYVELDSSVAEVRTWWVNSNLVLSQVHPNFTQVAAPEEYILSLPDVRDAVASLEVPFLSVDFARTVTGEWVVIEVGNGQVSDTRNSRLN